MPIGKDPNAGAAASNSYNFPSGTSALSTTNFPDLILVHVGITSNTTTVASVTSPNITFRLLFAYQALPTQRIEVWAGQSTIALNVEIIKVTLNASAHFGIAVIAITGAGAGSIDPNTSIPAQNQALTGFPTATLSTSNNSDMIIAFCVVGSRASQIAAGAGFTLLANSRGNIGNGIAVSAQFFNSPPNTPQTNLATPFGTNNNTQYACVAYAVEDLVSSISQPVALKKYSPQGKRSTWYPQGP